MDEPTFGYARAADGTYLAYLVAGEGPIDIVYQFDWFGEVDTAWDGTTDGPWLQALASLGRLILHDRRGTGLSSRNVRAPDLETRVADTLAVMDALGSGQPVLAGVLEGGAPNALLAATRPDRVRSLVWVEPVARALKAPDYPWGRDRDDVATEHRMIESWGTEAYGNWFLAFETSEGNEIPNEDGRSIARLSRHWCTPDVAQVLARIWEETDVRGALPAISVPALLLAHRDRRDQPDELDYLASLMPTATPRLMPGSGWTDEEVPIWIDEIRRFIGVEAPPVGLDTVLASVLFTDIVGSTERQAEIGDHAWKGLVERHHDLVRRALERWRGVERDTAGDGFFATFDGPARAVRCALEIRDHVLGIGLEVRAGVHTGECELVDRKVGGLAVSIGSRVATTAAPSEVLVSQTVKDLVAGSGLVFADAGEHELKGVPDRWHLYRAAG